MQVLRPRALIWVALRGPPLLPMSPGCHQEELGVTRRAIATGSLASMNLFDLRLGVLSETPFVSAGLAWSVQSWQGLMKMTKRVPSLSGKSRALWKDACGCCVVTACKCYLGGVSGIFHQGQIMADCIRQQPSVRVCPCSVECSEHWRGRGGGEA